MMKNDKDEPIALFGFTAYVRQGQDGRTRPIVFAYNGGPGSASAWLHMGILGPRRAVIEDLASNTRGPFKLVDNEFAFLDRADLVLIDPVGTGFSRPVGKAEGKQFWGVDNDIKSVSDFIVRYLGEYKRWGSPKFILGESYGGIRTGGVTYDLLTRHNVALNGIILVSPYLDFVTGHRGSEHRRGRRQLPLHVCGDGLVSQGAQPAPAGAGAVPQRSRAVGRQRLSPGPVQRCAGNCRGAQGGARRAGALYRRERRVLGRSQPAHGRKSFPAGADAQLMA